MKIVVVICQVHWMAQKKIDQKSVGFTSAGKINEICAKRCIVC